MSGANDNAGNGGNKIRLDSRTEALLRLQASRERIQRSMRPDHEGPVWHWLEHPFRFIRRWWQTIAPVVMASGWMRAAGAAAAAATGAAPEAAHAAQAAHAAASGHPEDQPPHPSLHETGEAVMGAARSWVREHPVASVGIAAALGALLIGKRGVVWGLLLGASQGLMRQGQGWLLRRISDPAMYMAILAALAARPAAEPEASTSDDAAGPPASDDEVTPAPQ